MNNGRQIVGASLMPGPAVNDVYHAFIWENGVTRDLGVLQKFPCLYDATLDCGDARAVDINNSTQVIGTSLDAARQHHAVLWAAGSIRDLGVWTAVAINGAGDIAGHADGKGYFWRGGSLTIFGSLGGGGTVVADMNDQTAVVGTSLTSDGKPHVFVWKPGQSAPTDLGGGPPGAGVGAVAVAINTRGDIIGYTCADYSYGYCALGGPSRAILWRVK